MTSKSLFFKLMKEDLRQRAWVSILAAVVFFFTLPVAVVMLIQGINPEVTDAIEKINAHAILVNRAVRYIGMDNIFLIVIAVVGALICGFSGFAYLHSKKQVDFYHSLPVRREMLFTIRFVDGILMYLVPYAANLLLSYLLLAFMNAMGVKVLAESLYAMAYGVMTFAICYLVAILGMMLTGKLLIAFMGTAVLYGYAPAIAALIAAFKEIFFTTLVDETNFSYATIIVNTKYLSPISFVVWMFNHWNKRTGIGICVLNFLVLMVVLLAVLILLYRIRKSEKAGISMAFRISEPIIRVLIAIPVGLVFGILFMEIQGGNTFGNIVAWLCFGSIVGVLLIHGIMESFYQGDVRKCLSHPLQLLGTVAATLAIAFCFMFDLFGFDSYIPKKEQVQSMALEGYVFDGGFDYWDEESGYATPFQYQMKHMAVEDIDAMYELARLGNAKAKEKRQNSLFNGDNYYNGSYYNGNRWINYTIKYQLKNGKEVYREYSYPMNEVLDLLAQIWENEQYKRGHLSLFGLEEQKIKIIELSASKDLSELLLTLTEQEMQTLLDLYKKEYLKLSFEEIYKDYPLGQINVRFQMSKETFSRYIRMYVYPSMKETMAFLKNHGFDMVGEKDSETIKEIYMYMTETAASLLKAKCVGEEELWYVDDSKDEVDYYIGESYNEMATEEEFEPHIWAEYVISDTELVKKLSSMMVLRDYTSVFPYFHTKGYRDEFSQTILNSVRIDDVRVVYKVDEYGNEVNWYGSLNSEQFVELMRELANQN